MSKKTFTAITRTRTSTLRTWQYIYFIVYSLVTFFFHWSYLFLCRKNISLLLWDDRCGFCKGKHRSGERTVFLLCCSILILFIIIIIFIFDDGWLSLSPPLCCLLHPAYTKTEGNNSFYLNFLLIVIKIYKNITNKSF